MRLKSPTTKPTTIDEYLLRVAPEQKAALQKLRRTIRAVMPKAEECISYGMPGFRLNGRMVVWFAATAKHCAFYPGGMVKPFADELADFSTSKGTIRFQPDHPLPSALIRKIVNARIAQNAKMAAPKRKRVTTR